MHALTRASRILERALNGLSLADFRVLSAVAAGEARASRLAARLAIGKPTVSATVDSLVRRGMLRRTAHDTDQRAVELALTAKGDAARDEAERALASVVTQLAAETEHPDAVLASLAELGDGIERRQASVASERGVPLAAGAATAMGAQAGATE